jgi:hypothetical protein
MVGAWGDFVYGAGIECGEALLRIRRADQCVSTTTMGASGLARFDIRDGRLLFGTASGAVFEAELP